MNDIYIEILEFFLISCERMKRSHIIHTADNRDDGHRISMTHEDDICEESCCATITIDEWMDLHKTVVEFTREEGWMEDFSRFFIPSYEFTYKPYNFACFRWFYIIS